MFIASCKCRTLRRSKSKRRGLGERCHSPFSFALQRDRPEPDTQSARLVTAESDLLDDEERYNTIAQVGTVFNVADCLYLSIEGSADAYARSDFQELQVDYESSGEPAGIRPIE